VNREKSTIEIMHQSDIGQARRQGKAMASEIGFNAIECEEISLVMSELATNLIKHAGKGTLVTTPIQNEWGEGIQIESHDQGPGIKDIEQAMTDGFSKSGSLGYGLGTVNRLMSKLDISSEPGQGTHILCEKWIRLRNILQCHAH